MMRQRSRLLFGVAALAAFFMCAPAHAQSFIGDIESDRLLGRDTAGKGRIEQLEVGGGLGFTDAKRVDITDAELSCLRDVASVADKVPYFTGTGTCALADLSAPMRTFLATSSSTNWAGVLTDETGTGAAVFANSPVLVTPNLGTPSAVDLANGTGLPIATGVAGLGTGVATFLATPSSANARAAMTDETGTGAAVFATSPVLVTPNLGTPSAVDLANGTGLSIATGVVGLGTGVATFLGTPSSANLATALTDETGDGVAVFGTSPALDGTVDFQEALKLTGDITPAQITANQNDYAPTGFATAGVLRLSSDAARNVTGLAGGADGRLIVIHNVGTNNIVMTDDDAASLAANRFALSLDITLAVDTSMWLQYDGTASRWRAIDQVGAGGGGGAPASAQYVTLTTDGGLTNERVLTAGIGIAIADGGAGGAVTVDANPAAVALVASTSLPSASSITWDLSTEGWEAYNTIEVCLDGASATGNEDMSIQVTTDDEVSWENATGDYAGVFCEGAACDDTLSTSGAAIFTVTGAQATTGCMRMTGLKGGRLKFTGEGEVNSLGFLMRSFYTVGLGPTVTGFRLINLSDNDNWDAGTYEVNGYYY